ncbi:MAG: glycosyltransferase family 2 protein [Anaerolineaceae bacterium]|nr:glycosyltransferase family 2 protein [Anaerolineaceae bacterium]
MPRVGQNPAKSIQTVAKPERITVAILNYIPFLSGFYANLLEVLKVCLTSIWENTDLPYDLLVFDNGSCKEVREYLSQLQFEGKIQYLILSEKNLGKGGAWNIILDGAPGDIIAYSDNDCYFYPGWLSNSLKVLENFPNVGMVTSRPLANDRIYNTATIKWAEETAEVKLEKSRFLDWETFRSFTMSLGHTEQETQELYQNHEDLRVTFHGVRAHIGAIHYQFLAYKKVLKEFLPFNMERPMGQVRQLDVNVNKAGYLRLMTAEPYMQNMSNEVPEEFKQQGKAKTPLKMDSSRSKLRKIKELKIIKAPLMRMYNWIFNIYWKDK